MQENGNHNVFERKPVIIILAIVPNLPALS